MCFIELHSIFLNPSLPSDCKGMFWLTKYVDVGTWAAWVNYGEIFDLFIYGRV